MSKFLPEHDDFAAKRRLLLALPLLALGEKAVGQAASPGAVTPLPNIAVPPTRPSGPLAKDACPLNSGGPSLLGTRWRLYAVYGHRVPAELDITMVVGESTLRGLGGCNGYTAAFSRVGYTGFKVRKVQKGRKPCEVIRPRPGAPTINVGNWEGNFIRTLQRMGSVRQQGPLQLWFFNRDGEIGMMFIRRFGTGAV